MTIGRTQVFFHDTPGFVSHEDRNDYKPALSAASREAIAAVNLTLLLVDASKDVTKRGLNSLTGLLERALRSGSKSAASVRLRSVEVSTCRQQCERNLIWIRVYRGSCHWRPMQNAS